MLRYILLKSLICPYLPYISYGIPSAETPNINKIYKLRKCFCRYLIGKKKEISNYVRIFLLLRKEKFLLQSVNSTDLNNICYIDLCIWLFYMVLNELFLEVIILSQVAACTLNTSNYTSPTNILKYQL
jgi:hypothetical protein